MNQSYPSHVHDLSEIYAQTATFSETILGIDYYTVVLYIQFQYPTLTLLLINLAKKLFYFVYKPFY